MRILWNARTAAPRPPRRKRRSLPALEWVEDAAGQCARATAIGSRSLLVENHTGIAAFTESRIVLNSRAGAVCALGRGLSLSCARAGAVIIRGDIQRIELPCAGGDAPDAQ